MNANSSVTVNTGKHAGRTGRVTSAGAYKLAAAKPADPQLVDVALDPKPGVDERSEVVTFTVGQVTAD